MKKHATASTLGRWSYLFVFVVTLGLTALQCSSDNGVEPVLPALYVWPQTISVSGLVDGPDPSQVLVKVDCDPHSNIRFTFSEDCSWLNLSNLEGTSEGVTRDSFSVRFDIDNLPVGTHLDSVTVASSDACDSPQYVYVSLTINPIPPELDVWPPHLSFENSEEEQLLVDTVYVTCTSGEIINFDLDPSVAWLDFSKTSGVTPDTVVVSLDLEAAHGGASVDTFFVTADNVLNSPVPVPCSLWIPPWQSQSLPLTIDLTDITFLDDTLGWAVGIVEDGNSHSGFLFGSIDGGENWDGQILMWSDPNDSLALASVCTVGETVWAVGESGMIWLSEDYGATWQQRSTGLADTLVHLYDICFVNSQVGWIVGQEGLILKTVDGGDTWQQQTSGVVFDLIAVDFCSEDLGMAVGTYFNVLVTDDGGATWTSENTGTGTNDFRDICYFDPGNVWIVGKNGTIVYTVDGGASFNTQTSGLNTWLSSVTFVNDSTGWISGQAGVILYTVDAGVTWMEQESNTAQWLNSIFFLDDVTGWAVGNANTIRFTDCGGNP
ncbi:MAG: hypothetical protein JSW34_01385 [Candidatus Zixiibacteriota bacterium]|nr:MAG: hypothetical protein JSW34_01385 [candidate division Zixibacteria bacterium]